jgi:dolichyl-phosphate beta-glucosyltransferase
VARIAVVVPCYNEEKRLDVEAFRAFALPGHDLRFLFVNDGSRDGTLRVLQQLRDSDPARFDLLDLPRNSGKAEAVRQGILKAAETRPDFLGFWDADLATPLAELSSFTDVFAARPEIDLIFAARVRLLGRDISRRASRHYIGRVGATLISQTLGMAIYDTQCGAKLFRMSDALPRVFSTRFLSKWIFDVEIIARYIQLWGRDRVAHALYELPLTRWRDVRGSKVGPFDFVKALRDLWRIRRAYRH